MRKTQITNYLLYVFVGCSVVFGGCSNADSTTTQNTTLKVGQFVSVFDKKVNYKCDHKEASLDRNGQFECQSFPISFYADSVKLGEINSIHKDGYVFPQDIIVAEKSSAVYSSDDTMLMVSLPE